MLKNYYKFIDKCTNYVQGVIEKSFELKDFFLQITRLSV